MRIGFIGLGNMATAIIGGLLREGTVLEGDAPVTAADLIGSAPSQATRDRAAERFGIAVTPDNVQVAREADVIVLAVKPQFFPQVTAEVREAAAGKLVISIAAGLTLERIAGMLGVPEDQARLIRCMPNTPALVNAGCTAVCPGPGATDADAELCLRLMGSFGRAVVIPERLMDAAGAVAGSSPAFVFLFIEALADGAVQAGMPRAQAYELAAAAVAGSAQLMLETGRHPGDLKDMVCSPGGTTIEGVRALESRAFRAAVMDAVDACVQKSRQL